MKKNLPVTQVERDYGADVTIVSMTDAKGIITYVNQDFINVSGFSEEELMGQSHNIVRHPDMPPAAFQDLWDTIKKGKPWSGIVKNRCKGGDHYWVEAFVTPLYEAGKLVGYQSVRTKPGRDQVARAEALYRALNSGAVKGLPARSRLADVGLRPRIFAALSILGLLAVLAGTVGVVGTSLQHQVLQEVSAAGRQDTEALQGLMRQVEEVHRGGDRRNEEATEALLLDAVRAHLANSAKDQQGHGRMEGIAGTTRDLILFICLSGLVVIVVTGTLLSRRVVRPMYQVMDIAKEIAGGELKQRIEVHSLDEIGQMLQALKMMQARLRTLIGRISESSVSLVASSSQLSAATAGTRDGMARQQAETGRVADAMSQMTGTIREVATNTAHGAEAAERANREMAGGRQVVERTIAAINGLAGQVEQAAGVIERLGEDAQAIGTILDVIGGIAEQTNLLALNAAIEAARAGDQGRGFAVVADEVRSLASRTQQSTQQIQAMIERLQGGAAEAVRVMHGGRAQAEESVRQAAEAGESLGAISDVVTEIRDMNRRTAESAERQAAVAAEIDGNLARINDVSERTARSAEETAASGRQIAGMADRLQGMVVQFDV